jgi:rod shape-determining protein MreC
LKKTQAYFGIAILLLVLALLPVPAANSFRKLIYSAIHTPAVFSRNMGQLGLDLFRFKKNADENRQMRRIISEMGQDRFLSQELRLENQRLTSLLELKDAIPPTIRKTIFARVIGRSPNEWNRVLLIDKNEDEDVTNNMLVLSDMAVVGKIIDAAASPKILLITDPSFKIGALIQRTRQHGIVYGTPSGECRMKYISIDTQVKRGDVVETAGLSGYFPKGFRLGIVQKVWKEPGQIYQVASIQPFAKLDRIEEVICVE